MLIDEYGVWSSPDTSVVWALCALAARRRSGCVLIWPAADDGLACEVFFDRGRVVAASCGLAQGPAALEALARYQPVARLRFFPGARPERTNADIPPDLLSLFLISVGEAPAGSEVPQAPQAPRMATATRQGPLAPKLRVTNV